MEFPRHLLRKWWDFPRIWSHLLPYWRIKDMRKSVSHFLHCTHSIHNKVQVHVFFPDKTFWPVKNGTWTFSCLLTAVWSKMRPNPMDIPSFSERMTWKFGELNLHKIHVMFEHGQQIKSGWMTWNSRGIWCGFGRNCRRFVKWRNMEFPWESVSYFLQGCYLCITSGKPDQVGPVINLHIIKTVCGDLNNKIQNVYSIIKSVNEKIFFSKVII